MHRTDVDDAARQVGFEQPLNEGLRGEERALQVDAQHQVVVGLGYIPKVRTLLNTGVVDQDVHLA